MSLSRRAFLATLGAAVAAPFVPTRPVVWKTKLWTTPARAIPMFYFGGIEVIASDFAPKNMLYAIDSSKFKFWVDPLGDSVRVVKVASVDSGWLGLTK